MDRYLLRYFLAVAETGNFSRAAGHVNVTQPTLSAGIAKLERQLGARLFDRTNRRVSLTAAGGQFLVRARRITQEYELALAELASPAPPLSLRVGVLSTIPTGSLERVVARHQAEQTTEELELVDGGERELLNGMERGRLDLALTILRAGGERFARESLRHERYVLVVPSNHRVATAASVTAEDLAGERMIVRRHCEALAETTRHFTQSGVRPPLFGLKTNSDDRALAMVRAGLGVTMMPESFQDPAISAVRLAGLEMQREIGLLYSDAISESRRSRSPFLRLVREEMGEPQP